LVGMAAVRVRGPAGSESQRDVRVRVRMQRLMVDGVQIVELVHVLLSIMRTVAVRWGCGNCVVGWGPIAWKEVVAGSVEGEGWQGSG